MATFLGRFGIMACASAVMIASGTASAVTVTFEDGTTNPFVIVDNVVVGTPGDASAKSLVFTEGTSVTPNATWTTGTTMTDLHVTARVRPSQWGRASMTLQDGGGWVASIGLGKESQPSPYGNADWCLAMYVDGPDWNDSLAIELNEYRNPYYGEGAGPNDWADAWYDLAIDVVGGFVTLSVSGPEASAAFIRGYEYHMDIDPVIVLQGDRIFDTDRPVLFDNINLTVPEPASLGLLALGSLTLIRRKSVV